MAPVSAFSTPSGTPFLSASVSFPTSDGGSSAVPNDRVPRSYERTAVELQSTISAPQVFEVRNPTSPYTSSHTSHFSRLSTIIVP